MRGAATVFAAVLIFLIASIGAVVSYPYVIENIENSRDIGEVQTVISQLKQCDAKLVETARTGTANTCLFSVNRGTITAEEDGIYYIITTKAAICDKHNWVEIDPVKHLWQRCDISADLRRFTMRWSWPKNITIEGYSFEGNILKDGSKIKDIEFADDVEFITLTVLVEFDSIPGVAGNRITMNRKSVVEDKVILSVTIS